MTTFSGLFLMAALVFLGAVIVCRWRPDKPSGAARLLLFAIAAVFIGFVLWLMVMAVFVGPAMRGM